MNVTKETITPKKAMDWLKRNVHNRPLSPNTISHYARAMEAGIWKLNGDCIRFNGNGDLIDGQHRLTACVQAAKQFDSYVVRGLDHDAFDTIDQGRKRTVGDVFARQGYKHYVTLAAAIRAMWRYEGGYTAKHGAMRSDEANALVEKHPAIHNAVERARELSCKQKLIHPGLLSFLIYACDQIDEDASHKFWDAVMKGEGLTKSMAAHWLRERLISNLGSVSHLHPDTVLALCIKAWNSFRSGKPCKTLKWSESESFPSLV